MPGRRGGGSSRGGRPPQSREMTVSKAMSFVLRHGAEAEGLKLDENGYANVAELVRKGFFCCWQMHTQRGFLKNVFRAQSFSVALAFLLEN